MQRLDAFPATPGPSSPRQNGKWPAQGIRPMLLLALMAIG